MCGITGKVSFTAEKVSRETLEHMNEAIRHRGPDDGGIYIAPNEQVGLGHCRLSIIDLSPLGHQPMRYLDRYELVFNGEIYNFQEKRALLEKEGYKFQSQSDSEVILALYDKYKEKCLDHLRGMFALAIYDEQEQTLFCARDRVGKKPFKYFFDGNVFLFASELKAILTQPEYTKEIDYEAIHHYLTLQYVPAPLTGFKGIKKLEPAHYLKLNLQTKELEKGCYWKLDYSKKFHLPETEWKKRILEKLDEAVHLRMIADVPIGAFLSGGIDSSAVVALMSRQSSQPIKTFSIGFKEAKWNELEYARQIANKFNTDHTEFIVEPKAIEILPLLTRHYEEPYADPSALPTYYLSKLTREHVTVALNGDGGDENFAGYGRYSILRFSLGCENLGLHWLLLPFLKGLYRLFPSQLTDRIVRFIESLQEDYRTRSLRYTSFFTTTQKNTLYTQHFQESIQNQDTYNLFKEKFTESGTPNKTEQLLYTDFKTYLPDDLLVKVDIASMAVALEGRSPFLDHEFLELTAQIPFSLKLKGFNTKKYILKETLRGHIPDEILFRPKMGFNVPLDTWFREELKTYAINTLVNGYLIKKGLFKKQAIERLLKDHQEKKGNYGNHIWALLTLELWFEEYFGKG